MPLQIVDPTWGDRAATLRRPDPLPSLDGAEVGIVSNGKQGTRRFFAALAEELTDRYGVTKVHTVIKSNYSAPAEAGLMDRATLWNALISGIGD